MIAKIGRGANILGVLHYNLSKVHGEKGEILAFQKIAESPDGRYTPAILSKSFEPYLAANDRTEKPILHISLNPDPRDQVSNESFISMAEQYMQALGYGSQPYIVFKHTDIDRVHIHIVSVCVDETGKKISDAFERRRSMKVCRELEQQFGLAASTEKEENTESSIKPVEYKAGNLKKQIAAIIHRLPAEYQFQSLGAYNALLSLFNITVEEVKGEVRGSPKAGLIYFPLNEHGEKISHPFKASLFGTVAGHKHLQKHFESCKESMKVHPVKSYLKNHIAAAMNSAKDEGSFKKMLRKAGIDTVVRENAAGRIYGITFIDHKSKTVWNGSQLGKQYSANVFHEWWKNNKKPPTLGISSIELHRPLDTAPSTEKLPTKATDDQNSIPDGIGLSFFWDLVDSPESGEEPIKIYYPKRKKKRRKNINP